MTVFPEIAATERGATERAVREGASRHAAALAYPTGSGTAFTELRHNLSARGSTASVPRWRSRVSSAFSTRRCSRRPDWRDRSEMAESRVM